MFILLHLLVLYVHLIFNIPHTHFNSKPIERSNILSNYGRD